MSWVQTRRWLIAYVYRQHSGGTLVATIQELWQVYIILMGSWTSQQTRLSVFEQPLIGRVGRNQLQKAHERQYNARMTNYQKIAATKTKKVPRTCYLYGLQSQSPTTNPSRRGPPMAAPSACIGTGSGGSRRRRRALDLRSHDHSIGTT